MKKQYAVWLILAIVLAWGGIAFADASFADPAVTVAAGGTVVMPASSPIIPEGKWYSGILAGILSLILGGMTWLSANASRLVNSKLTEVKTKEANAWYSMALNLAGIAVRYAETQFGADTATGAKKRELAVDWLMARMKSIDPKGTIDRANVAAFVDAAYHDAFNAVAPLK